MANNPFLLNVADLLGNQASSRPVSIVAPVDWKVEMVRIVEDPPLEADLVLHPVSGGIAVTGRVRFTTQDTCYRCLEETLSDRDTSVGALFDGANDDDESYPLDGHEIDVSQMLRDEVMLSLPIVEDCGDDCPGVVSTVQTDLNTGISGEDGGSRSPFAVLKDLLEPEDRTE
jgi:uncharacterized protein